MTIFGETIERELPDLAEEGVRSRFFGRRDRAPAPLRAQMESLETETAGNDRLDLWIAFDYGGRAELVDAARRLVEDGARAGRDRRGIARGTASRAGAARSRPSDPHLGRAAALELPPLAERLRRARLRRHALAGLRSTTSWRAPSASMRAGAAGSGADESARLARAGHGRRPAGRALPRLARRLVDLRARARRDADRPPRALRDGPGAAAARPRRLRGRDRDPARSPPRRSRLDDGRLHAHALPGVRALRDRRDATDGDDHDQLDGHRASRGSRSASAICS